MKGRKNGRKPKDFTGTISWSANTGCADSTVSGYPGVATCTTSTLAAGTDTVTATYGGDVNHNGGSGSVSQVVTASNGNVSVATSGSPSTYGGSVTFTATVTGDNGMLKRRNGVKPHGCNRNGFVERQYGLRGFDRVGLSGNGDLYHVESGSWDGHRHGELLG